MAEQLRRRRGRISRRASPLQAAPRRHPPPAVAVGWTPGRPVASIVMSPGCAPPANDQSLGSLGAANFPAGLFLFFFLCLQPHGSAAGRGHPRGPLVSLNHGMSPQRRRRRIAASSRIARDRRAASWRQSCCPNGALPSSVPGHGHWRESRSMPWPHSQRHGTLAAPWHARCSVAHPLLRGTHVAFYRVCDKKKACRGHHGWGPRRAVHCARRAAGGIHARPRPRAQLAGALHSPHTIPCSNPFKGGESNDEAIPGSAKHAA